MARILGIFALMVFTIITNGITGQPVSDSKTEGFSLRIVHTNDMHARFDETSALSTKCSPMDAAAKKCYGGFARLATLIRQAKNSTMPTLFLNAGDTYQGSIWFNVHKWKIVSAFLNILQPDAISLGNHEFDNGVEGLLPFLNATKFPVVTSNLDLRNEPELAASRLKNSTIVTVNGTRIGVIGYLTPETKVISSTGKVIFTDEVEAIRREVAILQKQGVKILIAVGHSGFAADKKIAAEVDGIDIVIGGHTNTFLYTGKRPDVEVPEGLYPTEIVQKNGRKVYVVQAYAYTKYLGNITVNFDANGEVTKILGNPILVDSSIEQAEDVLQELETWRPALLEITRKIVGSTKVLLDGDSKSCRRRECNFGNLISDSMVDYNAREYAGGQGWTDAPIALHNGGTIRNSINKDVDGKITAGDVLSVLPFNNGLIKVAMNGSRLLEVLEWGVRTLNLNDTANLNGAYLQLSGLQVIYDMSKPFGSRVHSVEVRCAKCRIPTFEKLVKNATYMVLTTDFLRGGGDGYSMLMDLEYTTIGMTTDDILVEYLMAKSPVHPGVEWRIRYLENIENEEAVTDQDDIKRNNKSRDNGPNNSIAYRAVAFMMALPLLALRLA